MSLTDIQLTMLTIIMQSLHTLVNLLPNISVRVALDNLDTLALLREQILAAQLAIGEFNAAILAEQQARERRQQDYEETCTYQRP